MSTPPPAALLPLLAALGLGCSEKGLYGDANKAREGVSLEGLDTGGSDDGSDDDGSDDDNGSDDDDSSDDCSSDDDNSGDSGDTGADDDETGEDDDCSSDDDDSSEEESELPYDVRPQLGEVFQLEMAFLEEGPAPAAILSVTMENGDWRLAELQANTPFTIDQADCDHEGNRDTGRDRIEVAWQNHDGSTDEDHLDIRYCKD